MYDARWTEQFERLKALHQSFGHFRISPKSKLDPELGVFVKLQRRAFLQKRLPPERERKLRAIGFFDGLGSDPWDAQYDRLRTFYEANGHSEVSPADDAALNHWVRKQRLRRRKGELTRRQVARLNELDFAWDPLESAWRAKLEELRAHRSVHGHCRVAQQDDENPALGRWVSKQRARHARGTLEPERVKALERIGFVWEV